MSWGLFELLVRESRRAAPESASEAVHLADLAVHVADMITEGEPFEENWIYQLRSLAWAALGNAYEVQGDLAVDETVTLASPSNYRLTIGDLSSALIISLCKTATFPHVTVTPASRDLR